MSDVPALSGRRRSESAIIASSDAGNTITLLNLRDEESFSINDIKIEYIGAGTVGPIQVEIHDVDSSTGSGSTNEEDAVDIKEIATGSNYEREGIAREDFENDVVILTDRDGDGQDADIFVTIGGYILTG